MTIRRILVLSAFLVALTIGAPHGALAKDAEYERLAESFNRLAGDPNCSAT